VTLALWPLAELSTEIVSGVACGKANAVDDGVLHLRPFSVTAGGGLTLADAPRIPPSLVPRGRLGFQAGDILFNNTNSVELVGKSAVVAVPLEASFSNHMTRIRVDATRVSPGYIQAFLQHLFRHRYFEARATRWVGQAAFGAAQLKAIQVPLPPLDEQRRIVRLLDRAAEIRRRADAARAKTRAIVSALFLDMFGDPATNPKRWRVGPLDTLLDRIDGGWSPVCDNTRPSEGAWGVLKLSAIKSSGFDTTEAKYLPDQTAARPALEVRNGDLLLTRKNTLELVGTAAIVTSAQRRLMLPDTVFRLLPTSPKAFAPRFLCELINAPSFRPSIRQLASGSAASMPGISKGRLLKLEIPLPPLTLQTAFADLATRIECVARALDAASTKADEMAAALSQEVFG